MLHWIVGKCCRRSQVWSTMFPLLTRYWQGTPGKLRFLDDLISEHMSHMKRALRKRGMDHLYELVQTIQYNTIQNMHTHTHTHTQNWFQNLNRSKTRWVRHVCVWDTTYCTVKGVQSWENFNLNGANSGPCEHWIAKIKFWSGTHQIWTTAAGPGPATFLAVWSQTDQNLILAIRYSQGNFQKKPQKKLI